MDEYERAASELRRLTEHLAEDDFTRIVDSLTSDANCRSAQAIMSHVVSAGYGYASAIRGAFSMDPDRPPKRMLSHTEVLEEFDAMLEYTRRTLEDRCEMSEADIRATAIQSRWGVRYDVEQLLEHAIVHVLRHRRQIEKLLSPDSTIDPSAV
jgi:uncharacterized damage-inducible protein DinB